MMDAINSTYVRHSEHSLRIPPLRHPHPTPHHSSILRRDIRIRHRSAGRTRLHLPPRPHPIPTRRARRTTHRAHPSRRPPPRRRHRRRRPPPPPLPPHPHLRLHPIVPHHLRAVAPQRVRPLGRIHPRLRRPPRSRARRQRLGRNLHPRRP